MKWLPILAIAVNRHVMWLYDQDDLLAPRLLELCVVWMPIFKLWSRHSTSAFRVMMGGFCSCSTAVARMKARSPETAPGINDSE